MQTTNFMFALHNSICISCLFQKNEPDEDEESESKSKKAKNGKKPANAKMNEKYASLLLIALKS